MRSMGKSTKAFVFIGILLVVLVAGRVMLSFSTSEDDKALIQKALAESIQASREGRPSVVMDKLSSNIMFNGQNEGGNQYDIARYIRNSKPEVEVENPVPVVTGDEAIIESPVRLSLSVLGQPLSTRLKDVTLVFRKEADRKFLIIPSHSWKLAEVHVQDSHLEGMVR